MRLKLICALVAVAALPFFLEATTGCSYTPPTGSIEPVEHNAYVCSCSCGPGLRHRTLRVLASIDDAEQRLDNSVLLDSPDLDFQNGRFVGLRFPDLQIPKDADIFSASVQFTAAPGSTTGSLTVRIVAEAADNAAAFTMTAGSLGALPATGNFVLWNLTNAWTTGDALSDQNAASLDAVVEEVVHRAGWAKGNALVLLFRGTAGTAIRKAYSQDGKADAAAVLTVEYEEPAPAMVGPQELPICLPPALVPDPAETDLAGDCEIRVQQTLSGLAEACSYPSDCVCGMQPTAASYSESLLWADKCDTPCVEEKVDVAMDCANFDPVNGFTTATNADGGMPVCAAYSPLGAEVFGRRTMCAVTGTAHVEVSDHSASPHAEGIVQFVGGPCPGVGCAVGMQYKLDIDSVTFGNFFHSETFQDLGGIGETAAGSEAMLSPSGDGSFLRDTAGIAAQGRRGSQLKGVATTNDDPVDVNVAWGESAPTCHVEGRLLGTVDPELKRCEGAGPDAGIVCEDDSQCTDDPDCSDGDCNCLAVAESDLSMSLDVDGDILNQPPTADAGPDQEPECVSAAVTNVVLDGSGSTDLDGNIALYTWLRGSRGGPVVGFDEMSKVEQTLGAQNYILRVIDTFGQTDEDTTQVRVLDRTPPVVSCSVATSVLNQTNHNLVNVGLAGTAVDSCEGELSVVVKVWGDENDEDDTGDGKYSPDAKDLAVGTLRLRAERKGNSDGRVYLVIPEAVDSSGNRGFSCCAVAVPYSMTKAAQTSAAAQAAAALAFCDANSGTAPAGYSVIGDGAVLGPKQ